MLMEKQECGLLDNEMMVSLLSDMLLDGAYGCFYLHLTPLPCQVLHLHNSYFLRGRRCLCLALGS